MDTENGATTFFARQGCCIYEKPRRFDESDTEESDDECEHCFGHVEHRRKKPQSHTATELQEAVEQTASITLQPTEPTSAPSPPDISTDS
ncbi:jg15192 [Pararge aegeria aegeria]|uniref:Jg15192 protein n=1 Tax=Pararge aegeria aegeria TaxID=348720 RepID=A0A8S4QQV1_9NEOP|nr:jg15192 [Pararge aegeria aegeria]